MKGHNFCGTPGTKISLALATCGIYIYSVQHGGRRNMWKIV